MKKLFAIFAIFAMTMSVMADTKPLATLSHEGKLTFFDSQSAFEEALDNAANGDTIYLSAGKFTSNKSELTITKRVCVIGCGYDSHITPNLTLYFRDNDYAYNESPLFDGVRLQTLTFYANSDSRSNLKKGEIRKSRIYKLLNGGYAGDEFLIDRCYIETADFNGATGNNTIVQNSKIGTIQSNEDYAIVVFNCNIGSAYYCPRTLSSSIIEQSSHSSGQLVYSGSHIIFNSLFHKTSFFYDSSSSIGNNFLLYDCYFDDNNESSLLDENLECTLNLEEKGYLGEDGTVIGVYGGSLTFSETPSLPTVDAASSSVEYDKENNKLNVTISVAPY